MSGKRVVVIGAGAGGLMAAGRAASLGADVTLLEKMDAPGNKLRISGHARCNVSNSRSLDDFILMYGSNGKFLYSAFHNFFREELVALLAKYDVNTSTEADGRIFPASGKSSDVVRALIRFASENSARLVTGSRVTGIGTRGGHAREVQTINSAYPADAVILATGGSSYPQTGSTGDGYRIAESLGHTIIRLRPALSPLVLAETDLLSGLQGISLTDIRLTAFACPAAQIDACLIPQKDVGPRLTGRKPHHPLIESRRGDIIFTHYGISGPAALMMGLSITDALPVNPVSLSIDLLPAFSLEKVEQDFQQMLDRHGGKLLHNVISSFFAGKIADLILKVSAIPADKKAGYVSAAERRSLAGLVKDLRFTVKSTRPLTEAMVTAGGISLTEIDPRSMESKLVKGLFFCGEVMDIDADTGGYNLQAAFSTGCLAGQSAAAAD